MDGPRVQARPGELRPAQRVSRSGGPAKAANGTAVPRYFFLDFFPIKNFCDGLNGLSLR
jgi:hypothetical protein